MFTFLRKLVLSINMSSPVGNLLVLINQSFWDYPIDAKQNMLNKVKKQVDVWYEIKYMKLFSQMRDL